MRTLFPRARRAFSLIELIVVITIIGIIAMFVIPAASTLILGSDITRASQLLAGQLAQARMTATTKNHPVEVRFIRYPDLEMPGENVGDKKTWKYRGIQIMEVFENGNMAQVGKPERMPGGVVMNAGRLSSLLDTSSEAEPDQKVIPIIDAKARKDSPPLTHGKKENAYTYEYTCFRFFPDGSTNLDVTGKWYITIYTDRDTARIPDKGPPGINYFTVQVDPASGSVRTFRPTAGQTGT